MAEQMELNGVPVSAEELRSLALCNYGHFTTMRVNRMRVKGLSLHLERLTHDCRALFGAELDLDRIRDLARRAAQAAARTTILRVTVYDPNLLLARPAAAGDPQILVTTRPASAGSLPPLRIATARYHRDLPTVKHVGLCATLFHRRQGQLAGHDDVLFIDGASRISEGATWNIGFIQDGQVVWPQAEHLPGITMSLIKDVMRQAGAPCRTVPIGVERLPEFSSAFITNTAVGLRAVRAVDDHLLADDTSLLPRLRQAYAAIPGDPL